MTKLTETQTIILTAGAKRPEYIAMPLPKGLAGAAVKMAVNRIVALGWLQESLMAVLLLRQQASCCFWPGPCTWR